MKQPQVRCSTRLQQIGHARHIDWALGMLTETEPAGRDWKRPMKRPEVEASLAAAARSIWRAFLTISSHIWFTCHRHGHYPSILTHRFQTSSCRAFFPVFSHMRSH